MHVIACLLRGLTNGCRVDDRRNNKMLDIASKRASPRSSSAARESLFDALVLKELEGTF